jgi:DNA-binding HxlR family transcriptional regulator
MISGKYKLRIVWDLKDGPLRYGEIRTGLLRGAEGTQEIAPRVLSRELKALTQSGLIDRKDFGVVPPKVEYRLTGKGRSLFPSFRQSGNGAPATLMKLAMRRPPGGPPPDRRDFGSTPGSRQSAFR